MQGRQVTGGYPYFIQELGWAAWGVAEHSPITLEDVENGIDRYLAKLDSSFLIVPAIRRRERGRTRKPDAGS